MKLDDITPIGLAAGALQTHRSQTWVPTHRPSGKQTGQVTDPLIGTNLAVLGGGGCSKIKIVDLVVRAISIDHP